MKNKHFSQIITTFHGRTAPEEGHLVGYGALIAFYKLAIPLPNQLALISKKNRQYNTDSWRIYTPRHKPDESLYKQLIFAIRYEGINLLFFKKLFECLSENEIAELIQIEPLGQYSRKIWFLYEWLFNKQLSIPNLKTGNFTSLIDEKIQYAIVGKKSSRHRIVNNLPGTINFCPLIYKTKKLEQYIANNLSERKNTYLKSIRKDVLQRASAFLLLKDSKASLSIEGENPTNSRAVRWGKAIGKAGIKPLSLEELECLQQIVIENSRFTKMGYRTEGGFVGEHDRETGEPLPEHISAKWQDVITLMNGLVESYHKMASASLNPVLVATKIAFGFVFIHPFEDGNGRLHRYLIHHILAEMKFTQQGIIFPISASILNHINNYRKILENYSHPLLDFIQWKPTVKNNVEVLNETADYYKYFDATYQAEFLFQCVDDTIENIIPNEVSYLQKYDVMKHFLDNQFEMPDQMVALLIRFLEQNNGRLSSRAKSKEFSKLNVKEVKLIERYFQEIFTE